MLVTNSIVRIFALAIAINTIVVSSARVAVSQHDPVFLMGSFSVGTLYNNALLKLDLRGPNPVSETLFTPRRPFSCVMDADNRHLLLSRTGGLYRLDPETNLLTTVFTAPGIVCYHTEVDQDGAYVCQAQLNSTPTLLRIRPGISVTTIASFSGSSRPYGAMTRDGDTGAMLVGDIQFGQGLVLSVDTETSTVSTWSTGLGPGIQMSFNPRTGAVETARNQHYVELTRGSTGSRPLTRVIPGPFSALIRADRLDLATDADPRFFCILDDAGSSFPTTTSMLQVDRTTFSVTSLLVSAKKTRASTLEFYRGRNTQSIRTGAASWDVRLSAPAHAGKRYVVVLSLSGMREGLVLADGRRVNLALDAVSLASLTGGLGSCVDLGPGVLDQDGAAVIRLDVAPIGRLNRVVHIAWAVLDPNAPLGVAFLPDSYPLAL